MVSQGLKSLRGGSWVQKDASAVWGGRSRPLVVPRPRLFRFTHRVFSLRFVAIELVQPMF